MKTQFLPGVLLALAVTVLAAPPCSAQRMGTVEFSPVVGAYVPHGSPVSESLGCLTIGDMSCRASRRQNIAIAVGGRATAWVNRWIALEGSVWYAASPVTADTSTTRSGRFLLHQTYDAPARVVAGTIAHVT